MKISAHLALSAARRKLLTTCCAALFALAAPEAFASSSWIVTSTADTDGNICDNSTSTSICTLRQAMNASNAAGGDNTIGFAIPTNPTNPTPQTITLLSRLPTIDPSGTVTSLTIDGTSQPGSVLNTNTPDQGGLNAKLMIEIVGSGSSDYGVTYNCCAVPFKTITLQGLNLHGFGFPVTGQNGTTTPKALWNIYGCFVGTSIDGTALPTQTNSQGINLGYDSAQIGGTSAWQRNLISGNGSFGVRGGSPQATVTIESNLIGTDVTGMLPIPNGQAGVYLGGNFPNTRVGCSGAGCTAAGHPSRNVISGNGNFGFQIVDSYGISTSGLQVMGNYIGTNWTGTKPLPNGTVIGGPYGCPGFCGGVTAQTSTAPPATIFGGFNPGEANLIAYNGGPGIVSLDARAGESFDNHGNAIHNNSLTDIAFSTNGWIANDAGDADTGANNQQNYPVIQSASVSGSPGSLTLNVTYKVDSATMYSTYPLRIDFYVDIDEGSGEFLVSDSYIAANAQNTQTVSLPLPPSVQALTGFVVSATDANGYSSELSPSWVFDRIFADRFEGH